MACWIETWTWAAQGGGTSKSAVPFEPVQDGDALIAYLIAGSVVTPPAGWTLLRSQAAVYGSTTYTIYVYRKNVVTSADTGVNFTWTQSVNTVMGLGIAKLRSDSGVIITREVVGRSEDNTVNDSTINIAPVTTQRSSEVVIAVAGCVIQTSGSYAPTMPFGMYNIMQSSTTNYRLQAAGADAGEGETYNGSFQMYSNANNAMASITVRFSEQVENEFINEAVAISETRDFSGSTYGELLAEGASFSVRYGDVTPITMADVVAWSDSIAVSVPTFAVLADTLRLQDVVLPRIARSGTLAETVGIADVVLDQLVVHLRERLQLVDSVSPGQKIALALVDAVRVADAMRGATPVTLAEALALQETLQAVQGAQLIERLGLAEVVLPSLRSGRTISESVRIRDSFRQFFAGLLADGIGIDEAHVATLRATAAVAEGMTLADEISPRMVLRAVMQEGVSLSAEQALGALYSGELVEGVELSAGYITPDGSFTTWAMNTRTGAVTEYDNYDFNSFAMIGKRYVGASEKGLFELVGSSDAGDSIPTRIKGGFLQFGGTRLSRLKAVYLATRGEVGAVLKIVTDDDREYIYETTTRHMRTTKVHMGKGQRARYFSFELTTADGVYDLDTLEFVPLVVQRRV